MICVFTLQFFLSQLVQNNNLNVYTISTFQVSSVQLADWHNQQFKMRGKHFLLVVPNLEYRTVENALCGNDSPVKKRREPQAPGQSELLRYNRRLSDQ